MRKAKYDLDEAEIKPYFELDNMVAAALWSAERRFGIAFKEITGTVPVFHPDVRVWEVVDTSSGAHRALFLSGQLRAGGKAIGRVGDQLPIAARDGRAGDGDRVEQQQLRQGRARRAGADLAGRREDALSRVRPRAAQRCCRTSDIPGLRHDAAATTWSCRRS